MIELSIEQACKHPFNFIYIWADEKAFLSRIEPKYAAVIRTKKANENKVIALSAEKYGTTESAYTDAIREAFISDFGMTPAQALVKLAQGETVNGINWAEGVYGIGSISKSFKGTDIEVDPKNGYMKKDGKYLPVYDTVYGEVGGKTVALQQFYYDEATGKTYMAQYNKTLKKYYAQSYSTADGKMYNASGKEITNKDAGTVWETAELSFDWLQRIIDWILSLFGGTSSNSKTLNADNTLPNQSADGFVQESGFGEAEVILLGLVAGGAVLAGGMGKKGKKK